MAEKVAKSKKKPNWIKIRTEYETTDISTRKLCDKYNVSYNTLKDRSIRETWSKSKTELHSKIREKTQQKAVEKISDRNIKHLHIWDLIQSNIEKLVKEELNKTFAPFSGDIVETEIMLQDKLETASRIMERTQKGHRLAEGILDEKDRKKLELETRRLLIEEQKLEIERKKQDESDKQDKQVNVVFTPELDDYSG